MNLQVVHYDVEPERTFIDYGPEGEELYLGEAPVICLTGVPIAEPVIDDSTERMGHYPLGTNAIIRRGFGELSVWHDDAVPEPTAHTELARLGLAVLFSNRWIHAARIYRHSSLGSIPADALNDGAIYPDFDYEARIREEAKMWREQFDFWKPILKMGRST